jgi:hypothetical protein
MPLRQWLTFMSHKLFLYVIRKMMKGVLRVLLGHFVMESQNICYQFGSEAKIERMVILLQRVDR